MVRDGMEEEGKEETCEVGSRGRSITPLGGSSSCPPPPPPPPPREEGLLGDQSSHTIHELSTFKNKRLALADINNLNSVIRVID